jgi:hypothetical protein
MSHDQYLGGSLNLISSYPTSPTPSAPEWRGPVYLQTRQCQSCYKEYTPKQTPPDGEVTGYTEWGELRTPMGSVIAICGTCLRGKLNIPEVHLTGVTKDG